MDTALSNQLTPLARAYYSASIRHFRSTADESIIAELVNSSSFAIETAQRDAWRAQIHIMRQALARTKDDGLIAFEFAVPRMGKRIDVLVVLGAAIYVLEFKVGEATFHKDAIRQVWDYALDLKNFHSTSHTNKIVPVLIATAAAEKEVQTAVECDSDGVVRPLRATPAALVDLLISTTALWSIASSGGAALG